MGDWGDRSDMDDGVTWVMGVTGVTGGITGEGEEISPLHNKQMIMTTNK